MAKATENTIREMNGFQVDEIVRGPVAGKFKIVSFEMLGGGWRANLRVVETWGNGELKVSRAKSMLFVSELRKF